MVPFAARCSLRPCVKNYQARVHNHEYTEKEIGNDPIYLDQELCPSDHTLTLRGIFLVHTFLTIRTTRNGKTIPQQLKRRLNFIRAWLIAAISRPIEEKLSALDMGGGRWSLSQLVGSQWLQNAYSSGRGNLTTVEKMVRGLSNGITTAMRNYPHEGESVPDADGELRTMRLERESLGSNGGLVYESKTCIIVNWWWIAYPVFLFLLQVTFCATMLLVKPTCTVASEIERNACELSDWKSSPLALVSLGWGGTLQQDIKPLFSAKAMNDIVGNTKVMLRRGDPDDPKATRWQLVNC
ncbi:hypothetical protein LX36DRAFT_675772 [Colletotrichum falcatum]|nr:hypothetical protein LX36DRAFT_675772 [Colletotrichum falcatum]